MKTVQAKLCCQENSPMVEQSTVRPAPCVLVIFGGSGDLTRRKLIPSLFQLHLHKQLPECFKIVGFARSDNSTGDYRYLLEGGMREYAEPIADSKQWESFAEKVEYLQGDYDEPEAYLLLKQRLRELNTDCSVGDNTLFYFATPPHLFETILGHLSESGLLRPQEAKGWSRIIVEKPFGHDYQSALELKSFVKERIAEKHVFRIDHYLGKETVQNILVTRFGNAIFEPLWNRNHIDHVQITAAETIGVGGRGGFYDQAGVLRDVVQNHLLEVLSLVSMEQPVSFQADAVRDEKVKVLRSLHPLFGDELAENLVVGQYDGYRAETGVAPDSRTPTYAALKVRIDNWRWQGVPFYLRAGKALAKRVTEVAIHFRQIPFCLFGQNEVCQRLEHNVLTLRIQPDEGIRLKFGCKTPGDNMAVSNVLMDFSYAKAFQSAPPEAYSRLLFDAMRGDQTLFSRGDAVEHAWAYINPLLDFVEHVPEIELYEPGTEGPPSASQLLQRDGRAWDTLV
jgi:glucose-6-phosphate 1-dehydrogenase